MIIAASVILICVFALGICSIYETEDNWWLIILKPLALFLLQIATVILLFLFLIYGIEILGRFFLQVIL